LGKHELSSLSDALLQKFCIGLYKDNALTHKMRFDDKDNFKYLIRRGISIMECDKNGHNTLHHAVLMEKVDFLSYLLEGNFKSTIYGTCSDVCEVKEAFIVEKA
jgi:ankyrin repeat protein